MENKTFCFSYLEEVPQGGCGTFSTILDSVILSLRRTKSKYAVPSTDDDGKACRPLGHCVAIAGLSQGVFEHVALYFTRAGAVQTKRLPRTSTPNINYVAGDSTKCAVLTLADLATHDPSRPCGGLRSGRDETSRETALLDSLRRGGRGAGSGTLFISHNLHSKDGCSFTVSG